VRDTALTATIEQIHEQNYGVYGGDLTCANWAIIPNLPDLHYRPRRPPGYLPLTNQRTNAARLDVSPVGDYVQPHIERRRTRKTSQNAL
jgi:hypothetical protein